MTGRGRAAALAAATSDLAPSEMKPRGRGDIFKKLADTTFRSRDADSKTNVSGTASSSSVASSQYLGDKSASSSLGSESGQYDSAASSTSSGDLMKKKAIGRARLFGNKTPTPLTISEDVKSKLTLDKSTVVSEKSDSGFTSAREVLPMPDEGSEISERQSPVIKHGQSGQKIVATANYIKLELMDRERGIYEYEVTFSPQVDSKGERIALVAMKWKDFGGNVRIFDGSWRIFSPERLSKENNVGVGELRSGKKIEVNIVFKRVKKFDDCKFVLNIIFKRIMNELKLVRFGRSDYNPKIAHSIGEYRLTIWPGCITAVDEYEGGIALCCDASHRVLRSETCLNMILDIRSLCLQGNKDFKTECLKTFTGLSVICNYNQKILKVDDVDFNATPKTTFKKGTEDISFIDYYKTYYDIHIKDTNQPMLVHRNRRKEVGKEKEDQLVYLVPELCSPTGLTDEMRSNFKLMQRVAEFTRVGPEERQRALRQFIRGIKENEKARQILADWNLRLPDTTIELIGRILPPEQVFFGQNRSFTEMNADWGKVISNNEVLSPVDIENWYILFCERDTRIAENFVRTYQKVAFKLGVRVSKPTPIKLRTDKAAEYCGEIRKTVMQNSGVRMFAIVFPSNRDDRYAAVKKLLNSDLGIASQVMISKTISNERKLDSIVTKIALQINCKVGGALWGLNIPYKKEGIMFCGIDAYHEGARAARSVIAFVASTNLTCTRWTSATAIHNRGQEITDLIQGLFRECLEVWHKCNNSFPARIVMFRDGVGDGQLSVVRDHEVPQFYALFDHIKKDYRPMLTYIIVQKRINTKLFVMQDGKHVNPKPGFVMDHMITRRDWYDYFLISQNVRQGTVSPTHFVVIHDSSTMKPDNVQRLTYMMTHLYYNWSGTVRVPAPCQYAHKLAYLVGEHMKVPANDKLRNLLYFL